MKLGLARAVAQTADVLLLDEPTGHLDASHVSWLVGYIGDQSLRNVTTVVVSHDASFLDRVCTHIIHAQSHKLRTYKGTFSRFLERVPDADLGGASLAHPSLVPKPAAALVPGDEEAMAASSSSAFTLPEPVALENVKSRGQRLVSLQGVSFGYPGSTAQLAVSSATVECSLQSRVAIVGPNGAGKSTLAALLVGELAPNSGVAWRHPSLRVAFVAQHTFHHLEQHEDLTATQYILWRFQGNEDREALELRADEQECGEAKWYVLNEDATALMHCLKDDPKAVLPDVIIDRRQRGRLGYEYEVRWRFRSVGLVPGGVTTWVPLDQLAAMGCTGMVRREDERQAAQRALAGRPLTTPGVEAHLAGFGLDAEEASHRRLPALSNGQRARVILAAATWLAPHLLVLDEPSNYLDRPALAALSAGLQGFGGGVVVISHNAALLAEVCTERWEVKQGNVCREGAPADAVADGERPSDAGAADVGGVSRAAAVMAAREAKAKQKAKRFKELRRKKGEQVSDSDEEAWYEDLLKKTSAKAASSSS